MEDRKKIEQLKRNIKRKPPPPRLPNVKPKGSIQRRKPVYNRNKSRVERNPRSPNTPNRKPSGFPSRTNQNDSPKSFRNEGIRVFPMRGGGGGGGGNRPKPPSQKPKPNNVGWGEKKNFNPSPKMSPKRTFGQNIRKFNQFNKFEQNRSNDKRKFGYGNPVMFKRKNNIPEKKSTKFSGYGNPVMFRKKNIPKPSPNNNSGGGTDGGHSRMFSAHNSQFKRSLEDKFKNNFTSSHTRIPSTSGYRKPQLPPRGTKPERLLKKMDSGPKSLQGSKERTFSHPLRNRTENSRRFKKGGGGGRKINPVMLESKLIRIDPDRRRRISRSMKIPKKRPKSASSITNRSRSKYNSLLISESERMKEEYTSEYFFAGVLSVKQKRLLGKKYNDYHCVLNKNTELVLYTDKERTIKFFSFNLKDSSFRKRDNLILHIASDEYEGDLTLKAPTNSDYNEWVTYLTLCGIAESDDSKNTTIFKTFNKWEVEKNAKDQFYQRPYAAWSTQDVLEWLKYIRLSYTETAFDLYKVAFEDQNINGEKIKELFMDDEEDMEDAFDDLSICDDLHQLIMKKEVLKLEKVKFFDTTAFVVQNKMEQMFVKRMGKVGKPFPDFLNYCKHFHRLDLLKKTIKHILTKYEDVKNGEKTYKVKFIMTENLQNWRSKQLRKFIGLPLSMANKVGLTDIKFGMVHTAFSCGNLQMEWVDNSLVLIRSISSEKVLICVDIGLIRIEDLDKFAHQLAENVLKWNREYTYDTLNMKKVKFHANCQQFVEYIVSHIFKLSIGFSKDIDNFMKNVKERGKTQMIFSWDNEFAEKFDLKDMPDGNQLFPKTHEELDQFINQRLLSKDPDFAENYKSKWELLKGFDRAFWMKHLNIMKMEKKESVDFSSEFSPAKEGCPFQAPE